MTHRILILSGNLAGLITAYRLIPYGFQVTILEQNYSVSPENSDKFPDESTRSPHRFSSQHVIGQTPPLILHRFHHLTWSLLEELALQSRPQFFQKVALEFMASRNETVRIPGVFGPHLPPIIQLALFRGLSWSDRWHMINFLEKKWEGYFPPDHHSDTLTVESWLRTARQSARAIQDIWNPLCRFFLQCDSTEASVGYFLETLAGFWFSQTQKPELYLAHPDLIDDLLTELQRHLLEKGATFVTTKPISHLQADTNHLHSIVLTDGERLSADAYVSPLPPAELLALLPERAPARFSSFSHLSQLQEMQGIAIQYTLPDTAIPSRLILHSGLFDWVTSQTIPIPPEKRTVLTGVILRQSAPPLPSDAWLNEIVWPHIQRLFNIFPEQRPSPSAEPQVIRSVYPYLPCQIGLRTFRPLSSTPIPNLFLTGPWVATHLPPSLESTVMSAYGCASTLAEWVQASSH